MRQLWNQCLLLKLTTIYSTILYMGFRFFTEHLSYLEKWCQNELGLATSFAIPRTSSCKLNCELH